jgi:hypothetical protein
MNVNKSSSYADRAGAYGAFDLPRNIKGENQNGFSSSASASPSSSTG